jgi:hypothetical protein
MAQSSEHAQSQAPGPEGDKRRGGGRPAHDVFVSYSGYDKPVADAIVSRLEQAGIRCWVAPRDAIPGEFFGKSIVEAIETSRLMVIVLSGEANQSQNVLREVGYAVKNGVVVVPFRIETIEPTGAMAYYLGSGHWLDAMTPPLEVHIAHLVKVAQRILDSHSATPGQAPAAAPSGPGAPTAPSSPAARPDDASSQPASPPPARTREPALSGSPSDKLAQPDDMSDVTGPGEPDHGSPAPQRRRHGQRRWIAALAALAVVIGGAVGGWLATRPGGASVKQPVARSSSSSSSHPWQSGNDSRLAVQQAPAAVLDGRIWVVGGLTGPMQATAKTEFYDPTVRTWGLGPALPVALNHAMMVTYRGALWVIGGFVSQGGNPTATASARVLKLNKAQNDWIEGPPLQHARAAAAAAVVGDKIVVAGGRTGDPAKPVLPTEVYNGTSWHDAAAIPTPGDHLAAASDGTYLYVVGGEKLTSSLPLAAVQRFNPATGQWTQPTPMPAAAANVGAAVVGGRLITLGGENLGSVFNTVRALNLTTRAWSSLPNMPLARHGMGVAVIGNSLYAVNGAAHPGHKASTKTLQILTLHS